MRRLQRAACIRLLIHACTHALAPCPAPPPLTSPPCLYAHSNYDEYIANVEVSTEYLDSKSRHMRVRYTFHPYTYEGIDSIEVKGSSLIPKETIKEICAECRPDDPYRVGIGLMDKVRERVEKW